MELGISRSGLALTGCIGCKLDSSNATLFGFVAVDFLRHGSVSRDFAVQPLNAYTSIAGRNGVKLGGDATG